MLLSAQATDVSVNKATAETLPGGEHAGDDARAGRDGLKQYIKTIGLYNAKAKNIIATCKILIDRHGSQVPEDARRRWKPCPGSVEKPPTS